MQFDTADDLARFYFDARERIGGLRALPLPVVLGVRCGKCGGPQAKRLNAKGEWIRCCADCDKPWAEVAIATPTFKGGGKADAYTSAHRVENQLAEQFAPVEALRPVFDRIPHGLSPWRWQYQLDCWRIYLHPQIPSVAEAARIGAFFARDARSAREWTPVLVGRAIASARETVELRASPPNGSWLMAAVNLHREASA